MKSDKLLEIIGEAKETYVLSALDSRNGKKEVHPHYSLSRIVLIAAMIALLLFLVGCGAYIIVRNLYWSEELQEDYETEIPTNVKFISPVITLTG